MFETLSDRLSGVFGSLTRQGALTDEDISAALREVRIALLEADVCCRSPATSSGPSPTRPAARR